ncbi:hypothetical protein UAJ10_09295 [Nitrospirillum sp. BR 11164]|uniref:DUF7683 domain-containing protein n=1 Tax=Nitrospirillum sp. BR 11164 TaxID=3104324 RepID=UPI002AFFC44A|nr:hypothetical protein [Nitrospirillum sp. BR 11164]MEA1649212.1 hypothetical protein [Nitrospirillum sp. BR 11164]
MGLIAHVQWSHEMRVHHQLVGYNLGTGRAEIAYNIADLKFDEVAKIAGVDDTDPEGALTYPLERDQARAIAEMVNLRLDFDHYDFCFEPMTAIQVRN